MSSTAASTAPTTEPIEVEFLGRDVIVPCVDGTERTYVDLDCAATSPSLRSVFDAVTAFLPYYGSANRGSGYKSNLTSQAIHDARATVRQFVDAPDAAVIFADTTTHAINVLAHAMAADSRVLCAPGEHHANLLPWRNHQVHVLPFTNSPAEAIESVRVALADHGPFDLLAVTGASNVTGEVWPLAEISALAHSHGTEVFVDAAQLAPHRRFSMTETGADYAAFSGHKLYAPFGSGALIARSTRHLQGDPLVRGGGAVRFTTLDEHRWGNVPGRFEAGSPNTVGILALATACQTLMDIGMDRVADHDRMLRRRLIDGLDQIPGVRRLSQWADADVDTIGVVTFTVDGIAHGLLSTVLGAEHAIGVRSGRFCANPLVLQLLDTDPAMIDEAMATGVTGKLPGAVRASIGLPVTPADIDRLIEALKSIVSEGPRWSYLCDDSNGAYEPDPDPRPAGFAQFRPGQPDRNNAKS